MRLAGRVAAAIEVLGEVLTRHRPASEALKDWGKAHRFAGSTDRHVIGTMVYDGLRQRNSAAWQAGGDTARHIVLGVLRRGWGLTVADIAGLAAEQHGPSALTDAEQQALSQAAADLPLHVAGNFPEWLAPEFEKLFGENAVAEGAALSQRAPIDLRVNSLKADRATVQKALAAFNPVPGPYITSSLRITAPGPEEKHANVEVEPAHGMGWFEVQDTASQIVAALSGVKPGETVADICAGAGGKTLALAALMQNRGRLVAHDRDRHRLRPIFERMNRAGASCIEVLPADDGAALQNQSFDCVVIDAPCSGTGAWRRKPETKWKLTPKTLEQRIKDQMDVLQKGSALVKSGGRLVYITCSILPQENTDQISAFLNANQEFKNIPFATQWANTIGGQAPASADGSMETLLLTPRQHDVDGFFVAVLERN
jgi:16S rRNA (cytosine967-C5)-methyltransferase